jgi:hypothetical protein
MYQRAQESASTPNGGGAGDEASSENEDVVDAEVVDEPKA